MDDAELVALFTGYGYQVRFVEYGILSESAEETQKQIVALNKNMAVSMEWALTEIRKIQKAAREGKPIVKPRWPLIIMRTPKVCCCHFSAHMNSSTDLRLVSFIVGNDGPRQSRRPDDHRLLPRPSSPSSESQVIRRATRDAPSMARILRFPLPSHICSFLYPI